LPPEGRHTSRVQGLGPARPVPLPRSAGFSAMSDPFPPHPAARDIESLFFSRDPNLTERLTRTAMEVTRQNFGRTMGLYAPLYIANYCENHCAYCGFQAAHTHIPRRRLSLEEIDRECRALREAGIRSCLLLTGESRHHSPPSYIGEAVKVAAGHFANVWLEIYPLETEEYGELWRAGADGVTLYQETYDRDRYDELHLKGPKKNYDYRVHAPERIAEAGFRYISMGALLGLADWRRDAAALFSHLRYMERRYPGVEYSLSFPRLRRVPGDERPYSEVSDEEMVRIVAVARMLFPRVGINLSTRETAEFRDRLIPFGITKISAGSVTRVGGYADSTDEYSDGQFQVHDRRSLGEIKAMLAVQGHDPVLTDWRNN
jgi:2-iminoacetate synthase